MDPRWRTYCGCLVFIAAGLLLASVPSATGSKLVEDASLNPLKYEVAWVEDAKKLNLLNYPEDKFNKMDMFKRHKKYTCFIPKYHDVNNENQDEDLDQKFEPYLVPLLSNCLRKWEGWWTYEFCYGKHMKQFHLDKAGNIPKDANFALGYDPVEVGELPQLSDLSEDDESSADDEDDDGLSAQGHERSGGMFDTGDDEEEMEEELKNTLERLGIKIEDLEEEEDADADAQLDAADRDEDEKVEQRVRVKKFRVKTAPADKQEPNKKTKLEGKDYFAIRYIKGTQCDLQDIPREAEIRFYCMPGSETSAITEVKEPATCRYTVRIDTPLICRHPKFKKLLMQPEKITCYSHSVTNNNLLDEPAQEQKRAATSEEDKTKASEPTTAQGTSETEQAKSVQEASQSDRIRKRINEKREQQLHKDEEETVAKTAGGDASEQHGDKKKNSNDKDKDVDEPDDEELSKVRDEL